MDSSLPVVSLLPGGSDSSCTFVLSNEDHTLGNALRFVLMRDSRTSFCGYSMPHPSEAVVNLRLQTTGGATSVEVFKEGLESLAGMCDHMAQVLENCEEVGEVATHITAATQKSAGAGAKKGKRGSAEESDK